MARVVCTLQVSELDGGVLCSRVAEPRSCLEDLGNSSYMCALVLHMTCGWEAPARINRFESSCSSEMETYPDLHIIVNET